MASTVASLWQRVAFALLSLNIVLLLRHQNVVCTVDGAAEQARVSLGELTKLTLNVCSSDTFPSAGYTSPVPYGENLAQLQSSLISSAYTSSRLYNNNTVGSGDAVIYGTFQCRGDLNSTECTSCLANAFDRSSDRCPRAINGRIELAACSFYYQNTSIVPDFTLLSVLVGNATNNSADYVTASLRLLQNVSAAAPLAPHFYSSASDEGVVYAIALCFGYLSLDECRQCVGGAAQSIDERGLGNQTFVHAMCGSCMCSFSNSPFFNPTPAFVLVPAPVSAPTPDSRDIGAISAVPSGRSTQSLVIGVSVGCSLLVLACCGFLLHRKWSSSACKDERGEEHMELQARLEQHQIRLFSPQQLKRATKSFQECNKLGEGGFGSVYKGILQDKQVVAIKKLTHSSHHGKRQFLAELETISSVQHRNLITLLGCCLDGSDKYLVFEYLSNQSLDKHLFVSAAVKEGERISTLPWSTRQKIILGTAKGLAYLHHESNCRIVHRDIKTANILLDENLEPKIADFGLARLFTSDQTHLSTVIAGTLGYLAPECTRLGKLTEKSDVYSFGMVVLEVLSGRRVFDDRLPVEQQGLLNWSCELYETGRPMDLMDPHLKGEYTEEEVSRLIQLSRLCTQTVAALRPTMSKVVVLLERQGERMGSPGCISSGETMGSPECTSSQKFSNLTDCSGLSGVSLPTSGR